MSTGSDPRSETLERLSAALDGEADPFEMGKACAQWSTDPAARERWHCYRMIGDVLRSDELASDAAHDASFLKAFRARLAGEPVVLAPASAQASAERSTPAVAASAGAARRPARRRWSGAAAVAAGFLLVAGVIVGTESGPPSAEAPLAIAPQAPAPEPALQLAASPPAATLAASAALSDPLASPAFSAPVASAALSAPLASGALSDPVASGTLTEPALIVDGKMLRDARLEQYLAAHKQFGGSSALGVPSGFLRGATAQQPAR